MSTCESRAYEHLRCLQAPYIGKQDEVGQAVIDRIADGFRGLRIASADIVSELGDIINGTPREPQLHWSKRRNAASTSASLANCCRRACAKASNTSGKCDGSIGSGAPSSPTSVSIARAISSWLSGGNFCTASSACLKSFVMAKDRLLLSWEQSQMRAAKAPFGNRPMPG